MIALFIGRFQPFHLGHLDAIKQIENDQNVDKIIIGIGSSQYSGTKENPFSYEERKKMLEISLQDQLKKPYKILDIPDIHNEKIWVEHVETIVHQFNSVYTGNEKVKKLFEQKKYTVKKIDLKFKINGTKLRELITNNDDNWKKLVPDKITDIIEKHEQSCKKN